MNSSEVANPVIRRPMTGERRSTIPPNIRTFRGLIYLALLHVVSPSLMQATVLGFILAMAFVSAQLNPFPPFTSLLKVLSVLWWMKVGALVAYGGLANWQSDSKGHEPAGSPARRACCLGSLVMGMVDVALSNSTPLDNFQERILTNGIICVAMYTLLSVAGILQRTVARLRGGKDGKESSLLAKATAQITVNAV